MNACDDTCMYDTYIYIKYICAMDNHFSDESMLTSERKGVGIVGRIIILMEKPFWLKK